MNRLPLLAPGLISLFLGLYGGLARMGVVTAQHSIILNHGALMISGFIATLIALERYVALGAGGGCPATSCWGLAVYWWLREWA